jgi:signal transduction histidine kinase/ActR/RegA family two-component response regulator
MQSTSIFDSIQSSSCPVTGLAILRRPEWTGISLGEEYRATISVLGGRIILSQPSGYITRHGVSKSLELIDTIARGVVGEHTPYVLVEDFTNLHGASRSARRFYIDFMKRHERLAGLIYFGASPMLRMSVKLGKRFHLVGFDVEIVDTYLNAIKLAVDMLPADRPTITVGETDRAGEPVTWEAAIPAGSVVEDDDWRIQLADFSAYFRVIDGKILHSVSIGYFKEELIEIIAELREKIRSSVQAERGFDYFVADVTRLTGASRQARKSYMESLREWHAAWPFKLYIFYGVNSFVATATNLARPFMPFKVRVVKNLDAALKLIAQVSAGSLPAAKLKLERAEPEELQRYVDELLAYIGGIDWEADGLGSAREPTPSHPFNQVFEAIKLIKGELDDLFHERRRAEVERAKLEAQLRRAQKMEAIGTLAGGVAHDLNNILSGIVSYPDLILMELPESSPLRKPVSTIQQSGEKAAAIVADLLTLARRGVAATEVENLNRIIEEYLQSPEHEKAISTHPGITIDTRLQPELLNILGSRVHLAKVVMNLISNAAEAMPDGGVIHVATENRYIDRPVCGYDEVQEGDYVTLTVRDSGVGIAVEDQERIFEPFFTNKKMGRSGTGLGMSVVWGTVKDHDGYIDVASEPGRGTTVTVYLPVTRVKPTGNGDSPLALARYRGNGESVLIVDDVELQRDVTSSILEKLGYRVAAVASGEEAVAYLAKGSADMLILDMIMEPGIDGLETYRRILRHHPGQKAIITSGFSETARVREVQELGAGEFVRKPFTIEKIGAAIKQALADQS